jgi:Histidine kinase-, DNA gyrase B-, and HSP90-like ATPase
MHDLSLYALEMIENSLRAGAERVAVRVAIDPARDRLTISVEDDGPGLDVSAAQATDPFFTTKAGKRTGLGLPLFREAAEAADGRLTLQRSSALGGVAIEAVMSLSHVDRPPLGDVCESVAVMAATNPQATLVLDVEAGAESCLAQGAELAAFGAVAARCAALLATADASTTMSTTPPVTDERHVPDLSDPSTHDPSGPTTPTATTQTVDSVDLRQQQRSVG